MPNCEIEMCEVSSLSGQSESSVLHLPLSVTSLGFKQLFAQIHTAIKEGTHAHTLSGGHRGSLMPRSDMRCSSNGMRVASPEFTTHT